jgi:DNA-binding NtrC family response regulator
VDDDASVREVLSKILETVGMHVIAAENGMRAMDLIEHSNREVAVVDLMMPGMTGIETARKLREFDKQLEVVILTGKPTLESSLEAHHEHVFDYLTKPIHNESLIRSVKRAAERRRLILENRDLIRQLERERDGLKKEVAAAKDFLAPLDATADYIGDSQVVTQLRKLIVNVAPSDATILLRGESGTGKDVVARIIHNVSGRGKKGDFVKINCPAIPETLLESEMFGHEAGSFTGAERRKPGRFEIAAGGTIFLDEIGDLPLSSQSKLLQVIEHKEFTRVGGTKTMRVDARIIAATNAPLEEMIAVGRFRADLFHRLNQFSINLPSLRERVSDIPQLIGHFLATGQGTYKDRPLSQGTLAGMLEYHWPGNVRELKAIIDRYVLTGHEDYIQDSIRTSPREPLPDRSTNKIDETEARMILQALVETRWNQRKTAEKLGISYSSLRRRIKKHDLLEKSSELI